MIIPDEQKGCLDCEMIKEAIKATEKRVVYEVILKLAEIANSANHMTTPVGMIIDYITELRQKYVINTEARVRDE